MTNRAKIHEFYNKAEGILIFQTTDFKFDDLLGVWKLAINAKFQLNISKIMPTGKKHRDMGCKNQDNSNTFYCSFNFAG